MTLPNQLTVLRIILTPIFLYLFLSKDPLLIQISLGVFIIAALTDWYDGWLARKYNYITDWGKFWDPLADKILTSTAFVGFIVIGKVEFWMVLLIVIRDLLITLLRSYADYKKIIFPTSRYAKWKTAIQMTFLYYLLLLYTFVNTKHIYNTNPKLFNMLFDDKIIYYGMALVTIITVHSGFSYLYNNREIIRRLLRSET
ncbi:MAG TPA: CDP-diacylglycerol--glycerol-3-phosphate 3-phosphatidyltransferase [Ignavibacteriaceae bacterium]|nr:CDP-diacylglycerol--glycerol-3-phosphate 3-phosphatidyltransferase [Ignavibacteriaceae bacterium]